jgi:hypothetical protein
MTETSIPKLIEATCAEIAKTPTEEWLYWVGRFTARLSEMVPEPPAVTPQSAVNVDVRSLSNSATSTVTAMTPEEWLQQAGEAVDPFDFDTCISRAIPFYDSADRVESARVGLFGDWLPGFSYAYLVGLQKYATVRDELEASNPTTVAHREAKGAALVEYRKTIDAQPAGGVA